MPIHSPDKGFTLIELAVVLVIIGLIAGGILVGRDLINAAHIRSVISQIDRYNTAVNTFRTKYNAVPGDMRASDAASTGLFQLGSSPALGQGDGDGMIVGLPQGCFAIDHLGGCPPYSIYGEAVVFWRHLSEAGMIEGNYGSTIVAASGSPTASALKGVNAVSKILPFTKLGRNIFVHTNTASGKNYFLLSSMNEVDPNGTNVSVIINGMTPQEAWSIDNKKDDGRPNTGGVLAAGPNTYARANWWAIPNGFTCITGGVDNADTNDVYNLDPSTTNGNAPCGLMFQIN